MLMMSSTLFWSSMRLDVVVCLTAVSALFCVRIFNINFCCTMHTDTI